MPREWKRRTQRTLYARHYGMLNEGKEDGPHTHNEGQREEETGRKIYEQIVQCEECADSKGRIVLDVIASVPKVALAYKIGDISNEKTHTKTYIQNGQEWRRTNFIGHILRDMKCIQRKWIWQTCLGNLQRGGHKRD